MVPTALKQRGRRFKSGIDDLGVLWQHNIILYLYELNQYYITVYILIILILLLHVCREKEEKFI